MKPISRYILLLISLLLIAGAQLMFIPEYTVTFDQSTATKFNETLQEKEKHAHEMINELAGKLDSLSFTQIIASDYDDYQNTYTDEGIALFGYLDDTIAFWTNHSIPIDQIAHGNTTEGIVQLRSGWFLRLTGEAVNVQIAAYIHIKHDYSYENKYLVSGFQQDFQPIQGEITRVKSTKGIKVHNSDGKELFTVVPATDELSQQSHREWMALLFCVGAMLLLVHLYREVNAVGQKYGQQWAVAMLIIALCSMRYLLLSLQFPAVFSQLELFDPSYYARSFWSPSLGDLLINALFLFALAHYFNKHFKYQQNWNKAVRISLITVFFVLILFSAHFINGLFSGLIYDSNIDFNISNLFDLSIYSFLGILCIGLTLFAYFFLIDALVRGIKKLEFSRKQELIFTVAVFAVFSVVMHLLGYRDLIIMLWPLVLFLVAQMAHGKRTPYGFPYIVTFLVLFSFVGSHTLSKYTHNKERDQRSVLADKLATDKDPVMEYLFFRMEKEIQGDPMLLAPFDTTVIFSKSDFRLPVKKPIL